MNSPLIRKLTSALVALLLLIYVGYQIYNSQYSGIRMETAAYFTASESVQTSGIAVRKEVLVNYNGGGVVDYVIDTGDKVAKGGPVAQIYSNEQQAAAERNLKNTDTAIEKLQNLQLTGNVYSANVDSINDRINQKLTGIIEKTIAGDISNISQNKEDILYLINEKQVVSGKVTDFSARIAALKTQRNTLAANAGKAASSVNSPASGYFIEKTDGFESTIDFSKVLSITCKQITDMQNAKATSPAGAIGKICGDYDWYFACEVPAEKAAEFRQLISAGDISINFPFISNETIPVTVAAVNQSSGDSKAAVILKCSYMDKTLASVRNETTQIITKKYTGIRVSSEAVHFSTVSKKVKGKDGKISVIKKEVEGVYALNGSKISFKQIFPKYSTENYVICDPNPSADEIITGSTVKLNDEVVVEGTDLYDGKVVK